MYLKALEIQGFKSFADKIVLNFSKDITAIVGPNGSGKSNISDAIRWVMGEQNSRNLRGGKMEDVIFGGTEKRSPMGFAQVTLVLDNQEHIFPRPEEEVAVTRRYYRSGESEYYINKQSVRLRDINELFMDTGLGREGYSIIGQGKIDEILSVKSEDRRLVFDEAAGISRYRHRKEETERKLSHTEENLVRIQDKVSELELQVEPLRQQAEVAKRYLLLRDELRILEISVWLTDLECLRAETRQVQQEYETAKSQLAEVNAQVEELYAAAEDFSRQVMEQELSAEELRRELTEVESRISEREAESAVLRTEQSHNRRSAEQLTLELEEHGQRSEQLQTQIGAQQQRIETLRKEAEGVEADLTQLLAQAQEAAGHADAAADSVRSLRAKEALATHAAAEAGASCSALQASMGQMQERQKSVAAECEGLQEQIAAAAQAQKRSRRALEDAQDEVQAVDNMLQGCRLRLDGRLKRQQEAQQRVVQLTMAQNAVEARLHLLSEMQREYEGFQQAVRLVMQAAERRQLRGIHGPVANLITVDSAHAVAIEVALGGGMQNLVVEREEDAKSAIGFLKQRNGGRATFLPMGTIRGDVLRERSLEKEAGFVGIASALVRSDEAYTAIVQNLLGHTVVVETLDNGIAMARKYQNRFRIVTLDGQVLNRGGSMTGGSISKSVGILSRANELTALRGQQVKHKEELLAAQREVDAAQRDYQAAQYETDTAQGRKRQAEDRVLQGQGEKHHYDVLRQGLEEQLQTLEREQESLRQRLRETEEELRRASQSREQAMREAGECRAQLEKQLDGQNELLEQSTALHDAMAEGKAKLAALRAEQESTSRSLQELQKLWQDMQGDHRSRRERVEEYRRQDCAAQQKLEEMEQAIAALRAQGQTLRERLQEKQQERQQLENQRTLNDRRSRSLNETQLLMQNSVAKLEQKQATMQLEEKQILAKLWERYELGHTAAMALRIELESLSKANRRIAELQRSIRELGTPNLGAIEEFERINTRYRYFVEQRDDVCRAKSELEEIIGQMTAEMTAIFLQQFQLLNESFQTTFAELFGGGRAQLELEDPQDVLNCGIEIRAQPPGKSLKTLTLLSGGERAFVAIALYFAILKVHPTPFCVMDEIEAALDEPNVVRYAEYMRRITGKTQFIAITHRRGTMEEADVLYGVTMQERGVSRVLSIDMQDMANELNLE